MRLIYRFFASPISALALSALVLCAVPQGAQAQISLSHITTYEVASGGDFSGQQFWDTIAGGPYDVFLIQGSSVNGAILNGGAREPMLSLVNGDNVFTVLLEPGFLDPSGGVSLFFNAATEASLSGYIPFGTTGTPPSSGAGHTIYNPYDSNSSFSGSGAGLSFAVPNTPNGETATMTSLRVFNSGVDRVGTSSVGASGQTDLAMTFTINVTVANTDTPEPRTLLLVGMGLAASAGMLLRKREIIGGAGRGGAKQTNSPKSASLIRLLDA